MFDDAALARGVHPLQYEQHRTLVVGRLVVGVQHLLQFGEPTHPLVQHLEGVRLGTFETRCGTGVDVGHLVAGLKHQLLRKILDLSHASTMAATPAMGAAVDGISPTSRRPRRCRTVRSKTASSGSRSTHPRSSAGWTSTSGWPA